MVDCIQHIKQEYLIKPYNHTYTYCNISMCCTHCAPSIIYLVFELGIPQRIQ